MKSNVKFVVVAFLVVIAINIAVIMFGFAGNSTTSTSTQQQSIAATSTPASEPSTTVASGATPAATSHPTATSTSGQTPTPTDSSPTPSLTQTATPTATQSESTPTPQPTPTPTAGGGGGGGGGGTLPTPTPTQTIAPTPTQTPTTNVLISAASQAQRGSAFTVDINITQVNYLVFAYFDLSFDANILELEGLTAVNWGNVFNPTTVSYFTMEDGLVRVIWDNADWANNVNNGYGASGSGTLCRITFTAAAAGTSHLSFVEGLGAPSGEHTLISWIACDKIETCESSEIQNVGWTNSLITVY